VTLTLVPARDVRKTEIRFGIRFLKNRTEPSKNLASVQTVFRQKLRANPQFMSKWQKILYLHSNVHIKNGLNTTETEI